MSELPPGCWVYRISLRFLRVFFAIFAVKSFLKTLSPTSTPESAKNKPVNFRLLAAFIEFLCDLCGFLCELCG
ncbi:MAG TPA: hypothetical protein VFA85_08660 [Terriglobales bacterium]|nr:hypothetical protein [Terriglobales bacterium]